MRVPVGSQPIVALLAIIGGATTVRQVAKAMDLSVGTVFKHLSTLRRHELLRDQGHGPAGPRHHASLRPNLRVVAGVSPETGRWMVEVPGE